MNKTEAAVPPQPNKRPEIGQRQRNEKGQFVRGNRSGGRPKLREEFKKFAQEKSLEALKVVYNIMMGEDTSHKDRTYAARLLMEYGYGRPSAEFDRERLDMDRARLEIERARMERETDEAAKNKEIRVVLSDDLLELVE